MRVLVCTNSRILSSSLINGKHVGGEKSFIGEKTDQRVDKCVICCQNFVGLAPNFDNQLDCLCGIFAQSESVEGNSYMCESCRTLLDSLLSARNVFLQCVTDLITISAKWVSDVDKMDVIVRLLGDSIKDFSPTTEDTLDDTSFITAVDSDTSASQLISSIVADPVQEQINAASYTTVALTNVSVTNELEQGNAVITIKSQDDKPMSVQNGLELPSGAEYSKPEKPFEILSESICIEPPSTESKQNVNSENAFTKCIHEANLLLENICDANSNSIPEKATSPERHKDSKKNNKHRKLHSCTICPRTCKTARELEIHVGVHLQERKYICEVCGIAYRHKKALEVHVGLHRGEAKFECEHCHKVFTQKSGLQRHLPIHTGEMAYQCDVCGKRFLYNTSFNVHKLTHTKHKEFQCFECGLDFFSTSHLKRHMKTHTGVRPHVCECCGKCFSERYNLDAHMRVHTGQKSHKCSLCDLGFNRKGKLEVHCLQKHSQMLTSQET